MAIPGRLSDVNTSERYVVRGLDVCYCQRGHLKLKVSNKNCVSNKTATIFKFHNVSKTNLNDEIGLEVEDSDALSGQVLGSSSYVEE